MASWSVICTANETPEHLKAFVAWHLGQGAEKIFLMLDNPADGITELFDHLPQVEARAFAQDYWPKPENKDSVGRLDRQIALCSLAYKSATTDWVLSIDADEFVTADDDIGSILHSVPANQKAIRIFAADRLISPDSTHWAGDYYRLETAQKYPDWMADFYNFPHQFVFGLRGHSIGKLFIRSGMDNLTVMPHRISQEKFIPVKRTDVSGHFTLLHMFVFDYAHYQRKGEWKFVRGPGNIKRDAAIKDPSPREKRRKEISGAFEQGNTDLQRHLYDDLFVFSEARRTALAKHQRVERFDFTAPLARYIAQYFP